jgi:hypothetical protein
MNKIRFSALLVLVGVLLVSAAAQETTVPPATDTVVPFELKGYFMMVKCRINDAPQAYDFAVDTGGLTCLDKSVADELGLKQRGPQAKINHLRLGGLLIDNVFVITAFPLQALRTASGIDIKGIIGSDLLEDYFVTLDYQGRRLVLSSSVGPEAPQTDRPEAGCLLPFKSHPINHAPMVTCRLNGSLVIEAMIDTGQPYPLVLPLGLLEKTEALGRPETIKAIGVVTEWPGTKRKDNYLCRSMSLEVGELKVKEPVTLYAELPPLLSVPLLGKDFLSRFLVTIDYPRRELRLLPRPGQAVPDNLLAYGFSAVGEAGGGVKVKGVWPGSPAAEAGLEVGDRILEFNSTKLTTETHPQLWALLQDDSPAGPLELLVQKSGGPKRVVLHKRNLLRELTPADRNLQ